MSSMTLEVLLPFKVFARRTGVVRVVAETSQGAFGLLPKRLDCVAALVPGILVFETEQDGEVFLAVDEGVMVKTGPDVVVAVRRAVSSPDLAELRHVVDQEYLTLDEHEEAGRVAMARLETAFMRRLNAIGDRPS